MYTTQFYRKKHESRRAGAAAGARDARARGRISATTDDECPTSERIDDTSATSNIVHACHHNAPHRMRSAARRLDMALAAHVVRCHASPRGSLASPPRVGGRGRWEESPSRGVSIRRRAFSSDAPATSPNAPPVTHLLTAYDMSAAPAMQVTPLRLAGTGAERPGELGSRLWRAIRLARDVRREGVGSAPELFAPAPRSWGEGVALRLGARGAVTDAVEASLRTENAAFALAEEPTRALDEALLRAQPEARAAYAALLREALYAHAAAAVAPARGFEVSRTRDHGVRLVETSHSDHEAPAAFDTAIDLADGGASGSRVRLVASRARARAARPHGAGPAGLAGSRAAQSRAFRARGRRHRGPPLVGTLLLEGDDGAPSAGAVGDPRAELNGDSLLEYHRKRYPARVDALRGADPGANAVWLVPGSGGRAGVSFAKKMAYPAELLAPRAPALDFEEKDFEKDFEASASPYDARTTQARVTALRAALGQPFVSFLGDDAFLAGKMTRLTEPTLVASGPCGRLVSAGSAASGPAVPPRADVDAKKNKNANASPKLVLVPAFLLNEDAAREGKEEADAFAAEETARLRVRLADGVAAAHAAWSVPSAAPRATRDDLSAAEAATWDDLRVNEGDRAGTSLSAKRLARALRSAARKGADRVLVETGGSAALESVVREACASARLPAPRRCAFEASARELAWSSARRAGDRRPPSRASPPPNRTSWFLHRATRRAMRNVPHQALKERCSWGSPASRAWRGAEASTPNAWSSRWWTRTPPCSSTARARGGSASARTTKNSNSATRTGPKASKVSKATRRTPPRRASPAPPRRPRRATRLRPERRAGSWRTTTEEPFSLPRRLRYRRGGARRPVGGRRGRRARALERDRPRAPVGQGARRGRARAREHVGALRDARRRRHRRRRVRGAREAKPSKEAFLARPLFLRRVAGATDALKIAREVVALAETRVDGFGGAHAMPVTLRGGGWQTRVLMV